MAKRNVLLIGGVNLGSAEEVFKTVGGALGDAVLRIPDGETGNARSYWIQCQTPFFLGNPQLEMVEPDPGSPGSFRKARIPGAGLYSPTMAGAYRGQAKLRDDVAPQDLYFDNFGYADWAAESYATFKKLKLTGEVPSGTRFQVCIPSTGVMLQSRIFAPDVPKIAPAYEAAIFREVERICAEIPHDELAIQWDCTEPVRYESAGVDERRAMIERMASLARPVPDDVELGYHLCYGDWEHRHMVEPTDTGNMVEIANGISAGVHRPMAWMHMPVPRNRSDDAYFAPLAGLKLHPETRLVLGLVHFTDGLDGTRRRMQAANKVVADYDIGTECGMARRPRETIPELLNIHKQVVELGI
jgi:methionine synthase II (cobalamin-independent)